MISIDLHAKYRVKKWLRDNEIDIRLVQNCTNIKEAWQKVVSLNNNFNILNIGLTELDLRNPHQILGKIDVDKKLIFKKKKS